MPSTPTPGRPVAAVLATGAETARRAPSIHNTQPWHWTVGAQTLELSVDPSRQLPATDPSGRMVTISCGAALHHARVALAAEGYAARVDMLPEPGLLARISELQPQPVTAQAMRLLQATFIRHTDRRPTVTVAVTPAQIEYLQQAAAAEKVNLHRLTAEQLTELVIDVSRAEDIAAADPALRAETAQWVGGTRPDHTGLPDTVIPSRRPQTDVGERDFGKPGTLPIGEGHDKASTYVVLFGDGDEPADWLRAGQALSAVWLLATELGLAVLPFSQAIEIDSTRVRLRRMLSGLGYPYLVLRLGVADPQQAGPAHTPRLPFEQTVELSPDAQPAAPDA
jgi:nitroreductase